MVTIITGGRDVGKTTKMLKMYEEKGGAGIVMTKHYDAGDFNGYDYRNLLTGVTKELATLSAIEPVRDSIGPYYFSDTAMCDIENQFEDYLENNISPIYLDEVGRLELNGRGFHDLLNKILVHITDEAELYIAVREDFVEEVVTLFNIKNAMVIEVI